MIDPVGDGHQYGAATVDQTRAPRRRVGDLIETDEKLEQLTYPGDPQAELQFGAEPLRFCRRPPHAASIATASPLHIGKTPCHPRVGCRRSSGASDVTNRAH